MRDLRPLPAALYLPGWQLFPPLVRALSLSTAEDPNLGPGMHVLGANSARPVGADALIGPQNGRRPTGVSRLSLFPFSHKPVGLVYRPLHGVQNVLIAGAAAQVAGDQLAQLIPISTADMMMPGVQKPHWTAASSTKARWMGDRPPSASWRPSTVRMLLPWAHTPR